MNKWSILMLVAISLNGGCSLFAGHRSNNSVETENDSTGSSVASSQALQEFNREAGNNAAGEQDFSKSVFVASDFMNVVRRVPEFVPGQTQFSAALPRTRYGEILMEQLRQAGFAIVLGDNAQLPSLSYSVDLPSTQTPDIHTFYVSLGVLQLRRSYEIFEGRIAPVSEMLMSGIDTGSLRPLQPVGSPTPQSAVAAERNLAPDSEFNLAAELAEPADAEKLDVQRINELASNDDQWDPLAVNLYDSKESVYQPMFSDSTGDYVEVSTQVLVFPNDSLVLGSENKDFLFGLADRVKHSEDIIRVVGCSHGKSQLANGNENLAKGRAVRVREELLLAGVEESAILHEACWANVHFDEEFPRRGVVVVHLSPGG